MIVGVHPKKCPVNVSIAMFNQCAYPGKDAHKKGYDEALLLNQEGTIAEGAGQNIFLVKDNELITNSEDSCILMGLTRDTIINLAKNKNIPINIG